MCDALYDVVGGVLSLSNISWGMGHGPPVLVQAWLDFDKGVAFYGCWLCSDERRHNHNCTSKVGKGIVLAGA
eukprot:6474346-Amphidinium_carterae.1